MPGPVPPRLRLASARRLRKSRASQANLPKPPLQGRQSRSRLCANCTCFVTAKQNILKPTGIQEQTPAARTLDEFLNETARVLGQPGIAKLAGASVGAVPRARPEGNHKGRALLDVLRTMRALLIYDNLETLSREEQEAMADFLRELPQGCKAIITSRRRGGEGAVWLRVEKLDWDAARGIIENEMARDAGLATKLRRVESRWQELFDETNGSPLALVHTLGLMRVRATLTFDGALAMLRGNRDADLQKFIFQEARKELTTNDKTALGALSFFVPSATFEAWMQVADLSRNALDTTIDRLSALSLVDVLAVEERYALHPLTRAFVRDELLADANVARETGMQFAGYWWFFGGAIFRIEDYAKFRLFDGEEANIDAAANWLWKTACVQGDAVGDEDAAKTLSGWARTLCGVGGPLFFLGLWDESIHASQLAYEVARFLNYWEATGWHAYELVFIYYHRARVDDATLWMERCIEAWAHCEHKREQALGIRTRGMVAELRQEYQQAEQLYQEAYTVLRDNPGNSWQDDIVGISNRLGTLTRKRKEYDAAERYYREALELAQKIENHIVRSEIEGGLGALALDRERRPEARKWLEQELVLAKEIGHVALIAHAQYGLARVHEAEGCADLALPLAQEALKIYERLQHKDLAEVRELVEKIKKGLGNGE